MYTGFWIDNTYIWGQKNRESSGSMVVIFGAHTTQVSGGLIMVGSGVLPTVGNFGLIMVIYMDHQKRYPG